MTDAGSVTQRIARFVVETDRAALPEPTVSSVKRAVLDALGVTIAGAAHPAAQIVVDSLSLLGSGGGATVVGSPRRAGVLDAAMANGFMAHVLDWDDALLPMRLRGGAVLLPAILAAGEASAWRVGSGPILSYALGFEVAARLGRAISPSMPERGWHGTGVVGGIGVAAAVGRLAGLDQQEMAQAIGIAGTGAQGLVATFGSMAKGLNLGRASAIGVQSAYLAAAGFTSHPDLLGEGRFLKMYDDDPRYDAIVTALGERWLIEDDGFKPYPCGVVAHAAIDAVLDARRRLGDARDLEAIHLTVSPETERLMGNQAPRTGLEAKFSVRYAVAAAWLDGAVLPSTFDDAPAAGGRYDDVMSRIEVVADPSIRQHEARAEVRLSSNLTERIHVRHARGTRERPMSDEEIGSKFHAACEYGGNRHADRLIELVANLDEADPLEITALLRPGQ